MIPVPGKAGDRKLEKPGGPSPARIAEAEVRENEEVSPGFRRLVVETASPVEVLPGQFFQVETARQLLDPLLRRPMSLAGLDGNRLSFFYHLRGKGTGLLAAAPPGTRISLLGPLGTGYPPPAGPRLLIGGGTGAAGLLFLAARMAGDCPGTDVEVFLGARRRADLFLVSRFRELGQDPRCATDDGSCGFPGRVSGLLAARLAEAGPAGDICACGPVPMLREIFRLASPGGWRVLVSLENMMACGFGVCRGCVVPTVDGYRAACHDGPVFDASLILWDEYDRGS